MTDKSNGKVTNIEMEIMLDEQRAKLPYLIQNYRIQAKLHKARYDSLIEEGFSEQQAMEIVKTRPLYE